MSRYRKSLAAFIVPIVALPFADWAGGGQPFSWGTVLSAILAGAAAALSVYMTPNAGA